VKRGIFDAGAIKPVPVSARIPEGIEIKDGDLLLTRSNTRERVGDVCLVLGARAKTLLCDLIYRLTPQPTRFDSRFLMYQLLGPFGRRQIEIDARGSSGTMPKISQRHIRSWTVIAPPLEEQVAVVTEIEDTTRVIVEAARRAQTEIDLLREYRTRLIADLVTGKLDVREAAAGLPDEPDGPDEPEPLDAARDADGEPGDDLDTLPEETLA
jgi:type I restriction enzyme S subunit